jgi:hypothetical protein
MPDMPRTAWLLAALALAATAVLPEPLAAQAEFAVPLRPGQLRLDITPFWLSWDQQFDPTAPGTLVPIAAPYASDSFGVAQVPALQSLQDQIGQASGQTGFALDLGRTEVALTKSIRTIPIGFELGLTRRLAIGATVPIVRSRVDVGFRVDSSRAGNVYWNNTASPGDSTFRSQMSDALAALRYQADSGPPALRPSAQEMLDNLQLYYNVSGAPLLPRTSTAAGAGITSAVAAAESSYAQLAAQYLGSGVSLPTLTAALPLPDSASTLRREDLERLFSDPALPFAADTFGTVVRTGIGDVSTHLTYQLADGDAVRSQILLTVRFPTGTPPSASTFTDLGTGTHQLGLDAALASDLRIGSHLLLHTVIRGGGAASDHLPMRVTPADLPFASLAQLATIRRTPARYVALDLDPVWMLDDAFSVRVLYSFFSQGATRHSYVDPMDSVRVGFPASTLDEGTAMRWMRVGAGVTFSTIDRYTHGLASLPYTLTVSYQNTIWGRLGFVPKLSRFSVTLRAYISLFGRSVPRTP